MSDYRKSILPSLLALLMSLVATHSWARPALQKCFDVTQPDGTVITLRMHGDEFTHFTTTADGYTVVRANDGFYHYAQRKGDALLPTAIVANNPGQRGMAEREFLLTQTKMVRPAMTNAQKQLREHAAGLYTGDLMGQRRSTPRQAAAGRIDYSKFKGLVILVNFTDKQFHRDDANTFYKQLTSERDLQGYYDPSGTQFNTCDGSVRDYFRHNSLGTFDPTFDVVGPIQINYKATDAKGNDAIYTLINATLRAANSEVDYTQYDLDNDGTVDMVYFIFAGYGSYVAGNSSDYVWPHAADLSWYSRYYGLRYDGMKFGRYACSVEFQDVESAAASHQYLDGIGTMCHEFSHVLGLADHYDTDYEENGQSIDPGAWDVMARGADFNGGFTPAGYNAYERYTLGFAPASPLDVAGTYELHNFGTSNEYFHLATGTAGETFYIENRQKEGWDRFLPHHGMLVWRVDSTSNSVWMYNTVNNNPNHNYYELVRAVPSKASILGSDTDPFPGKNSVIDLTAKTTPALLSWHGAEATLDLFDIAESDDGVITFKAGKDLYQSLSEDFENMSLTQDDAEALPGKFCQWSISKGIIADAATEGFGNGQKVVKLMRSGTLTTSTLSQGVREFSFDVWSGSTQVRVNIRAFIDGSWQTLKYADGKSQAVLAKNKQERLVCREAIPAGSQVQVQLLGSSNSAVGYVDDVMLTYSGGENAIHGVTTHDGKAPQGTYNLAGQRVDSQYRGIVVSDGKKRFNKR